MSSDNDTYDYQRHAILFVDDEANSRKYFKRLFGSKFRILEAEDGVQALQVFRENAKDIGIIVTDQRMPNDTGVGFLSKIAADYPDVIKILSTAYADIDAAIGSVNQGGIFKYITKPWDIPELEITLRRAMEFYIIKRERDALLGAKMLAVGNVLLANRLAAFAFVPVCCSIPSAHASEAIASFIRLAISSPDFLPNPVNSVSTPDLGKLHARQIALASLLEKHLPAALSITVESRVTALARALEEAGASGVSVNDESTELSALTDPTPELLESILGNESNATVSENAIKVLAAMMAVYDGGNSVVRKRAATLQITVSPIERKARSSDGIPGFEAAKWLIEDELLVSAALGIL